MKYSSYYLVDIVCREWHETISIIFGQIKRSVKIGNTDVHLTFFCSSYRIRERGVWKVGRYSEKFEKSGEISHSKNSLATLFWSYFKIPGKFSDEKAYHQRGELLV